jgi:polyferredoxin
MNARKRADMIRLAVQVGFFVLIALISVNHTLDERGKGISVLGSASLHSLCPMGGVVSVYRYLETGTMVRKTHESSFVLMWIGFGLAILLGPVFCGWVCPMGSIQEWFGKIGKKLFKRKYNTFIPYKYDKYLRYLRYPVMAWVLYMTAASATLVFADYDPYYTLFHLWTAEVAVTGVIILTAVLVLSLFIERPFCKYACPYGALIGIFNLFRIFKIRRNADTCIDCEACDSACPMNIKVSTSGVVRDHQCISCMKCTSDQCCPVPNTVEMMTGTYKATAVKGATE